MPTVPVVNSGDGARITVNDMIRDPLLIRARVLQLSANQFLADAVLRNAGSVPGGVVRYEESTPLFADNDPEIVEEGGEIPIVAGQRGLRKVAHTVKRAMAIKVTEEHRQRNNVDDVNRQISQVTNTMRRAWDLTFFNALLNHPDVASVAASGLWSATTSKPRFDIHDAIEAVTEAASPTTGQENSYLDFEPDTLLIGTKARSDLFTHDAFQNVYQGNIADENLQYTGKLPNQIFGLDVLVSRSMPAGKAVVMQRKVVGGIADEFPYDATPLYQLREIQSWRSDVSRRSAVFIDQPLAAALITGI